MTTHQVRSRPAPDMSKPMTTTNAPPGTFAPGTKVQVGQHRVVIEKYLSEGGFAHVYVVKVPTANGTAESAVLKRVAVADKEALASMRTEVETMKKLKGHKHIVTYIDSHASQLKGGGYEVFLLMEYCSDGGLIDFMNTRLKNRLTEPEVLHIFGDAAEGLACMHYLKPPLLHRDLKIENILISTSGRERIYKLCDFGSTAPPRPAATSAAEGKLIEDDVQRHTTLQYRSPEMIDVYRNRPIDEKSDIWALGVMLYKLCYYTTPFEDRGQMAILTASFKFPHYPPFSDRLKKLIASMLSEEPRRRPTIYQVLSEACAMRGKAMPIKDIYAQRTASEARKSQQLPPREPDVRSPPLVGVSYVAPEQKPQEVPDIQPMRRGRPTSTNQAHLQSKPNPALGKPAISKDPFAALDSTNHATRAAAVDELAGKFPALEDFSLLQNKTQFQFTAPSPSAGAGDGTDLKTRVTHALADDAFGNVTRKEQEPVVRVSVAPKDAKATGLKQAKAPDHPQIQALQSPPTQQPIPTRPKMVSTGTMTGPASPKPTFSKAQEIKDRPAVWKVPTPSVQTPGLSTPTQVESSSSRPSLSENSRRDSSHGIQRGDAPASSRRSLENLRRASLMAPESAHRSRSTNSRTDHRRAESQQHMDTDSSFDRWRSGRTSPADALSGAPGDESNIESNVDYLKAMEEQGSVKGHNRRSSSRLKHVKHPSISSVSKGLFSGRLGDTLKRFEGGSSRAKSPNADMKREHDVEASDAPEAAGDSALDIGEGDVIDEMEDLSPEMRRELERRRLSQEERRVASAAAVYRAQVQQGPQGPQRSARASAIQDRVKNLLDESGRTSPVKRTAEGYGRYTAQAMPPSTVQSDINLGKTTPPVARRPGTQGDTDLTPQRARTVAAAGGPSGVNAKGGLSSRPNAPPKPVALRTGGGSNAARPLQPRAAAAGEGIKRPETEDDWEASFAQRYPKLSLDMVETDIVASNEGSQASSSRPLRVKEI